jgi:hypothetical protein
MSKFEFLKAFNSPFKQPKLKWYVGKTEIGVPYFLPRKVVKATHETALKAAKREIKRLERWNERNPNSKFKQTIRPLDEVYQEKLKHDFFEDKKIGFDFVGLGWKTKWEETDYRFEWSPIWSFVFFGYQIAVQFQAPEPYHYWEAWLYYNYNTKGTQRERIEQCKKHFPLDYIVHSNEGKHKVNYYKDILKSKFI